MKKIVGLIAAFALVCTILAGCHPRPSEDYSGLFASSQEESSKKSNETRRTFAHTHDMFEILLNIDLVLANKPRLEFEVSQNGDTSVVTYTASVDDCLKIELNCDDKTDKIGMVTFEFDYNNAVWDDYKCYLESILSNLDEDYTYTILDNQFNLAGTDENMGVTYGLDGTVFYAFHRDSESSIIMMTKKG